ncbi:hypothetical protein Taro_007721 [Colocasia esculenta]|uniref:Uncharacterized protein n=1 Tax=Colocasia esculenta TaxID=4460 RepID=A0A843U177_COLES|nr:hypothetical protein [Colocasia esculenta]
MLSSMYASRFFWRQNLAAIDLDVRVLAVQLAANQGQPEGHSSSLFSLSFPPLSPLFFSTTSGDRREHVGRSWCAWRCRDGQELTDRVAIFAGTSWGGELDDEICIVMFFRTTLRLDDWRVGGPQPVSWDVECDSVLCVLLVVVLSRLPWSPFSTV